MSTLADPKAIRTLAADLARPRQDIEAAFVAVGARLTEGAALLNTLSKLFEALPEALGGADVEEATTRLSAVATRAEELAATFGQEKADLARLVEVVAAASAPISDLKRAVKMMGIVSVNARVTAASIVGDSDDFDVFTTDIASLSDSASRTIQDFAQVYRQLTAEVDRAANQRARFEATHAHTLSHLGSSLATTLEALGQQRTTALASSAQTGRVSRQIVGRIGSAVMALQVGDATRQRIEHVEAALSRLAEHQSDPALAADHPAALAAISTLQHTQLRQTAASFAHEVEQAEADLSALAADAGTIMARSRDFGGDERGKSSAIASLSAQLRTAVTILADFETERAKLEIVAAAVQETVRVLLEHVEAVQEIESNMRLVSLNAAVRCAQLGPRGASLTVIASQLRELTSETVVAAEAAMARLDESSSLAGSFGAAAAGQGAGQVGALEDQANLALDILSRLDQHMAAALARLNNDGPRVIKLLEGAAAGLSGQTVMAETMDDMAITIAALSTEPAPTTLSPALADLIAGLRKTYTMEAERQAHDRLFPKAPGTAAIVADEAEAEMNLEAFML
ncbi:hypothetical protein NIM87_13745 [Devosia sp. XJ19-1]|uniref:Methyl-accepting transducer domain-containing protein n=1 Tax=Devosia ureilytica TaxID=2952754 RepID=A0A9Q4AR35_9HYPH|nr:hypothetical protein [Devosia ureilytica]MCP8884576.1 hypothetical protein [Devosia ureilytica]MCP8888206.1 hypothetical protein [Devosia ureilytica]